MTFDPLEFQRNNELYRAAVNVHNPMHTLEALARANTAGEFYNRLVEWINDFDAQLDAAHEVGVRLVSFGREVTFHLTGMSWRNPSLISFTGKTDQDQPVELIQHVSQISILLVKLPRLNPDEPKARIGFRVEGEDT
jgi:hypothetical protein